jgi:hypothetical protein
MIKQLLSLKNSLLFNKAVIDLISVYSRLYEPSQWLNNLKVNNGKVCIRYLNIKILKFYENIEIFETENFII